jgi:hypothetical protein
MADGPIRRKTEKAVRDRAGVPVTLLYDETNDKTIMARADSSGQIYVVATISGEVETGLVKDEDGDNTYLEIEEQNNRNKLFVNSDDVVGELEDLLTELRIMNIHLSNMTDMQISKDDLGED